MERVLAEAKHVQQTTEELDLARNQLNRLLTSRYFRRSERLRRFLSYIAQRSLFGDAPDLKEYSIAVDVFDKDDSFDPRSNPIVRVEARRLRSKLKEYYATEGADDAIRLDLHPGSYALVCRRPALQIMDDRSRTVAQASVLLQRFSAGGESRSVDSLRDALVTELLDRLSHLEGVRILLWDCSRAALGRSHHSARGNGANGADWIVEGGLRAERTRVRVSVRLIDAHGGELGWARSWDLPPNPTVALLESFAGTVANSLRPLLSAPRA